MARMREDLYCPISRQGCKVHSCVMWKDDACLVVKYLSVQIDDYDNVEFNEEECLKRGEERISRYEGEREKQEKRQEEILDSLKNKTNQRIVDEIVSFTKTEIKKEKGEEIGVKPFFANSYFYRFWQMKGFDTFSRNNKNIRDYVSEIERQANRIINDEVKNKRDEKIEIQKRELPKLIDLGRWKLQIYRFRAYCYIPPV